MSMSAEDRVQSLVSRWLSLCSQSQDPSLEEICSGYPELLPVVQRRLNALEQSRHRLNGSATEEETVAPPSPPASESATIPPPKAEESSVTLPPNEGDSPPTLPPGETGHGSASPSGIAPPGYEILGELGRGGMGVVYKARQVGLNRLVALKMILAGGYAGEAELARFKTEGEAIARLRHANIVAVHEAGEHDGKPFFSLEFCEGGSLDRKLNGVPLPPREAAKLVQTLAVAMQAAHEANLIHRDLKPANVLLTPEGTPKITDFGLAKKLGEQGRTQTGAVMGTPSYMAPEQAQGHKDVGPPADVYALGAILYECLTGRPPFRAATSLDTILQVVSEEPVPPRVLQKRLPRDLERVVLKCLAKKPGDRFTSARELAADLERFQQGEPVQARRPGMLTRFRYWVRHPKRIPDAGLIHLLVCLLFALHLGLASFYSRSLLTNRWLLFELIQIGLIGLVEIWIGLGTIMGRPWAIFLGLCHWLLLASLSLIDLFWGSKLSDGFSNANYLALLGSCALVPLLAYGAGLYAYLVNRERYAADLRSWWQ
jgi:serine/threonine protein kinase